ncbi:MAG: hypothetical protein L3J74_14325 [Bacteroidales bacterium]|nr:hypothetical protein [Bacteroidales bacterium]
MIATYQKTCFFCGREFIAHKSHAKFCSSTCRVKSHRQQNVNNVTKYNVNTMYRNINNVTQIDANTMYCNDNNVLQKNTMYRKNQPEIVNPILRNMFSIEEYRQRTDWHFTSIILSGKKYQYIGNVNDAQLENFMSLLDAKDKIAWDRTENGIYKLYATQEVIDKLKIKI